MNKNTARKLAAWHGLCAHLHRRKRQLRWGVSRARRWRPWYTISFHAGPLDGLVQRRRQGGWVALDEHGDPHGLIQDDCYWLLHEPNGKRVYYGWDTEASDEAPCPCCWQLVLVGDE